MGDLDRVCTPEVLREMIFILRSDFSVKIKKRSVLPIIFLLLPFICAYIVVSCFCLAVPAHALTGLL